MGLSTQPRGVSSKEFLALKADLDNLATLANANKAAIGVIVTLVNELKADMSEHVHGGITAGSADSSAGPAIAAADAAAVSASDATITTT
jgi:acyl-coenzyme A thioesterase PaaI-like protein